MTGRTRTIAAGLLALALAFVACGDDADGTATETDDEGSSAVAATVQLADTDLGEALVDADGMTLYLFTKDSPDMSACTDACAATWPPLTVDGEPTAGDGVDAGALSTFDRGGGTMQVAYEGVPLYRYAPDEQAGDVKGQGVGGVWFLVGPDGEAIEEAAAPGPGY